jgi:hypothetical protein
MDKYIVRKDVNSDDSTHVTLKKYTLRIWEGEGRVQGGEMPKQCMHIWINE